MVRRPAQYRWSSYGANAWGDHHWLAPHPEYQRLDTAPAGRWFAYRERFKTRLHEEDLPLLRRAAHYRQPVADDRFRQQTEERYGIKLGQMNRGRPRKEDG